MLNDLLFRLRAILRRNRMEDDLDEELRFHFEHQVSLYRQQGITEDEARRRARLAMGGIDQAKEECRDARGVSLFESLLQDLRYAARVLRKSPGFTVVAILSLAIGIGANTVMFSLLDQALLRLLPVQNPEEIVLFKSPGPMPGMYRNTGRGMSFSYPLYCDFRDHGTVFSGAAARFGTDATLNYGGQAEHASVELVTGNYFAMLGVASRLGRVLTPDDDHVPNGHPVAVLSYGFWQHRFGGDPAIVGRSVSLNNRAFTVVGISAQSFRGIDRGLDFDLRVPMMMKDVFTPNWPGLDHRDWAWLNIIARMKPPITLEQAQTASDEFYRRLLAQDAEIYAGALGPRREEFLRRHLELVPGARGVTWISEHWETQLYALMAMVGLVLLITCANLAGLLIARTAARGRELAIRMALGAGSRRLARQLLTECVLLAGAGTLAGFLLAYAAQPAIVALLLGESAAQSLPVRPDVRVLGFTAAVAIGAVLFLWLVASTRRTDAGVIEALKSEGGASSGPGRARARRALVTVQIALCVCVLAAAGLFARTLGNLKSVDIGLDRHNLVLLSLDPISAGHEEGRARALYTQIEHALAAAPGVDSVASSDFRVLGGSLNVMQYAIEGFRPSSPEESDICEISTTPAYFRALGMRLLAGRDFMLDSKWGGVIVNRAFVQKYFRGRNPVGKHVHRTIDTGPLEIVGVVPDIKLWSLRDPSRPIVYLPSLYSGEVSVFVRTRLQPEALVPSLRRIVEREAPGVPVYSVTTMDEVVANSLGQESLLATLAACFGLLATLLAAIGLYGVIAYSVARRTHEMGIRISVGASSRRVVALVMKEVAWMLAGGLILGLPAAMALSRLAKSRLFGISAADPFALAGAGALIILAATAAGLVPALRAARIDPVRALRHE
jgi:predicted permease